MTFINCPKCNANISDKSTICAYCGFILNNGEMVKDVSLENNAEGLYDLTISGISDNANKPRAMRILKAQYGIPKGISKKALDKTDEIFIEGIEHRNLKYISMQFNTCGYDVSFVKSNSKYPNILNDKWESYGKWFRSYNMPQNEQNIPQEKPRIQIDDTPIYCPRCGSTAITTGARGVNLVWGLIGASKTVNRCGRCGYVFSPKK